MRSARNAIVQWDPITGKHKVRMIDFGHCVLRNATYDEEEWRRQQQIQDEEGAMGGYMQSGLERIGRKGYYVYMRSEKYEKLDEEFADREDDEQLSQA